MLTVPLTSRQREIDAQIDTLDRRVLLAALLFILGGAGLGYTMAERIADPVSRLTRATRRIARGDFDVHVAATSSDELRRLVEDFNRMASELQRQRAELERTNRLEAWAEMARQVAHEIKNPLTPIQLNAEHLRRVHADRGEPLGPCSRSASRRSSRRCACCGRSRRSSRTSPRRPRRARAVVRVAGSAARHRRPLPRAACGGRHRRAGRRARVAAAGARRPHARRRARSPTSSRTRCTRCPGRGTLTVSAAAEDGFVAVGVSDTGGGHGPGGAGARVRALLLDQGHAAPASACRSRSATSS